MERYNCSQWSILHMLANKYAAFLLEISTLIRTIMQETEAQPSVTRTRKLLVWRKLARFLPFPRLHFPGGPQILVHQQFHWPVPQGTLSTGLCVFFWGLKKGGLRTESKERQKEESRPLHSSIGTPRKTEQNSGTKRKAPPSFLSSLLPSHNQAALPDTNLIQVHLPAADVPWPWPATTESTVCRGRNWSIWSHWPFYWSIGG